MGDEDEGSPPRGGANPGGEIRPGENREISGCPLGWPQPIAFPSEFEPAANAPG